MTSKTKKSKISSSIILSVLLLTLIAAKISPVASKEDATVKFWALIISGSENGTFSNDAQYMYHA